MGLTVSSQARRELIQRMVPRYREVPASQKGALLDEIVASTGYARRYAMWLLNHPTEGRQSVGRQRQRVYGPEVQQAIVVAWNAANRIWLSASFPFFSRSLKSWSDVGIAPHGTLPKEIALHECSDSRSAPTYATKARARRTLYDAS